MSESALQYFQNALSLLQRHYYLVLIPFSISLLATIISILSHSNLNFLSLILQLSLFGIMPMVYGRFNELVTNRDFISWKYLFNKYFLKYIGLLFVTILIMGIPVLLLTMFMIMTELDLFKVFDTVVFSLSYHLFGLYILPLVFYENTVNESIVLGFKCLLGNIKFNFPFILIAIILSIVSTPVHFKGREIINSFVNIAQWGIVFLVNLSLFIVITQVLKDKLYKRKEV